MNTRRRSRRGPTTLLTSPADAKDRDMNLARLLPLILVLAPATALASDHAFVYANNPKAASYTPDTKYSFNPDDGQVRIKRSGVGTYDVRFDRVLPDQAAGGNVQVTAYGPGSETCKVASWRSGNGGFSAAVRCFNAQGRPADTRFCALVTLPSDDPEGAFAWAGKPNAKSYTADAKYSAGPGGAPMITRRSIGSYSVKFAKLAGKANAGGHVQVTAYGPGSATCKVARWNMASGALIADVLCFANGRPSDSMFSILAIGPN